MRQSTVKSTISVVMKDMLDHFALNIPLIEAIVYDPNLSYNTSIHGIRAYRSQIELHEDWSLPLLAWNRSVLRPVDELQHRGVQRAKRIISEDPAMYEGYSTIYGTVDFNFALYTKNMFEVEEFEIMYSTGNHIRSLTQSTIDLGELGQWPYFIHWNEPLESLELEIESVYYKSVGGTARINGHFLALDGTGGPLISDIRPEVINLYDTIPCSVRLEVI